MKYPKEIKKYISNARSNRGKKNGVVKCLFDYPDIERKIDNSKNNYKRNKLTG